MIIIFLKINLYLFSIGILIRNEELFVEMKNPMLTKLFEKQSC